MARTGSPRASGKVKDRSREDVRSTRKPRRRPDETPPAAGDPPRGRKQAPVEEPPSGGRRSPKKHLR